MESKLLRFILQYLGVPNTGDTDQNRGQCVGLIEVWTDFLGLVHTWGNAKDLLANADPNVFEIVYNTPEGVPPTGAILVYGSNWGNGFGHTGIVLSADVNNIVLFEQNNPTGSAPVISKEVYGDTANDCLGWLIPKVVTNVQPVISIPSVNTQAQPVQTSTSENSTSSQTVPQTEASTISQPSQSNPTVAEPAKLSDVFPTFTAFFNWLFRRN